ncbi:hypothetical protein L2725_15400 [Shewanella corallii]|uniref:Uncharacterized protein n=2 Tax=Shewanella TaxID=22 RepID=A0ABT0NAG6_9GAMM|nr:MULTISPECIES: hypothetical protein [Shewanella]MCL1038828.1 hypothetical protein [Shewanella submarina]MCL2915145.1 hypothetical protein [Shewanella corallii]
MEELIGLDVISISAPQDRSEFTVRLIGENREIRNIRFANDDGTKMRVDFSHISLNIIYDHDGNTVSLGELEAINRIDKGFEIVGDFGIIWLECSKCFPAT